jgi:beta-glucosidase
MNKSSFIKQLLSQMTLEEKAGQLHQVPPFFFNDQHKNEVAGPLRKYKVTVDQLYRVGSILGTAGPEEMVALQKEYLTKSRLKIPLMFMADIIHGYKTIFPIPLAMAATFSPELATQMARLSSIEATTSGLSVTFSPMADLARDARWGRVMESSGENKYVNYQMTKAMVEGYQGSSLKDPTTLAACGKHVAAYGAAIAGKDYTQAELSKHTLYQYYLEGYRACVDSKARLMMSSFNVIEGVPATINEPILNGMLRKHLGFKGIIISDYDSLNEVLFHRAVKEESTAALLGMLATLDIEMSSALYQNHLPTLVRSGKLKQTLLDKAVTRVLSLKYDLGLFDDPYRGVDTSKERTLPLSPAHLDAALTMANEGQILLKNEEAILPLKTLDNVVFIGKLVAEKNLLGSWAWHGDPQRTASLAETLLSLNHHQMITHDDLNAWTEEDVNLIKQADKVIVIVGETSKEFGEARSKISPQLNQEQVQLMQSVAALNPNIISIIFAGRPLVITPIVSQSKGILYSLYMGSMMAKSVINTLLGMNNPSGKLPMTLPYAIGQLPVFMDVLPTGRPFEGKSYTYTSHFIDGGNTVLYPFGYGLSYSQFSMDKVRLAHRSEQDLSIDVTLSNLSNVSGKTVIFAYLIPPIVGVALPSKILVSFKKVSLDAESRQIFTIIIQKDHCRYYDAQLKHQYFKGPSTIVLTIDQSTEHSVDIDL